MLDFMAKISMNLDYNNPLDTSIFACLTISFYGVAQLRELVVPCLNASNPIEYITCAHLHTETNQSSYGGQHPAPLKGEDMFWSQQHSPTNPVRALANHLHINNLSESYHLFSYLHKGQLRPLTSHKDNLYQAYSNGSLGCKPGPAARPWH